MTAQAPYESRKMTRAEFYEKYGDVTVTFASYYKYTFGYEGKLPDGSSVVVSYGGNHDDIYRHDVGAGVSETIKSLQPYAGTVRNADGVEVESFYDY